MHWPRHRQNPETDGLAVGAVDHERHPDRMSEDKVPSAVSSPGAFVFDDGGCGEY